MLQEKTFVSSALTVRHVRQKLVGKFLIHPVRAFVFANSCGYRNVPYDAYQPMIFQGEEMSIGIRGFTVGYDFYAPERSVCFHHYAIGKNAASRNKVKHFWENGERYKGYAHQQTTALVFCLGDDGWHWPGFAKCSGTACLVIGSPHSVSLVQRCAAPAARRPFSEPG
jgi:Glycosyltransferase (GlcNAc)